MRQLAFSGLFLFALRLWAGPAQAASFDEDFYGVIAAEQAAHRQPATACDRNECRRWWWREGGETSLLAVEHVKNSDSRKVLALCWRRAGSDEDLHCLSDAGRRFPVAAADAEQWRDAYRLANQGAAGASAANLDLTCLPPTVIEGDSSPGRNPVVGVRIRIADGSWSVRFALADGQTIDRAAQYKGAVLGAAELAKNNAGVKQPAIGQWVGVHRRKSDVAMVGSLYQDGPSYFHYVEYVASTLHPEGATIMVARCQSSQPLAYAAPPPATAPAASTAPPSSSPSSAPPASPPASSPAAGASEQAMTFTVDSNGECANCATLTASGEITNDSVGAFAQMLKDQSAQGRKLTALRLHSPGGSVMAALAIGRATRAAGLKTVAEQICASACSLVFMGGATRHAAPMMLGVHQFSASDGAKMNGALSMGVSQILVSELLSYAKEMGIDSEVIGIASATPPGDMHYFGATELLALGLNTK